MFCEYALQLNHRNNFIPENELFKYQEKDKEFYRSYYSFDSSILTCNTVRSYKGVYYLKKILLDIDKGVSTDEYTLLKARSFYHKLKSYDIPDDNIQIYFSGRGYHFSLPNIFNIPDTHNTPQLLKKYCSEYFEEADNIFDGSRLIRVVNSINIKSGLYKIPLYNNELLNLTHKEIHTLAEKTRKDFKYFDGNTNFTLKDSDNKDTKVYLKSVNTNKTAPVDIGTNYVSCIRRMYDEGPVEGLRHIKIIRMISSYKRFGLSRSAILSIISNWATNLEPDEIVKQVNYILDKDYTISCNDEIMAKYCDPRCIFFKKKNLTVEVKKSKELEKNFVQFVTTDFGNSIIHLDKLLQLPDKHIWMPGEFIVLLADTGMGKTTLLQNICTQIEQKVLFLSLEVSQNLLFRKFIQINNKMTKEEVYNHYTNSNESLHEGLKHISVVTISPNIESIRKLIIEEKPQLVVIDVLDQIVTDAKDATHATMEIATVCKELANTYGTIIFGIHHINKQSSAGGITVHSGKGSSAIEQKADKVYSLTGNKNEPVRILTTLKARDDSPFTCKFMVNWDTFEFIKV